MLRSESVFRLGNTAYKDVKSLYDDTGTARQLPTGAQVIGRIHQLVVREKKTKLDAYRITAEELSNIWIYGLNVFPVKNEHIIPILEGIYEKKINKKKKSTSPGFKQLVEWPESRRNEDYYQKVREFNEAMKTGLDIHTDDKERIKRLQTSTLLEMKDEDLKLLKDNCRVKECPCEWNAKVKCKRCPRQMVASGKVDKAWVKWKERKLRDIQTEIKQQKKMNEASTSATTIPDLTDSDTEDPEDTADDYQPDIKVESYTDTIKKTTRSNSVNNDSNDTKFPQVPLWLSEKKPNPVVMNAFTHCAASYKVTERDLEGLLVDIARMVFNQDWIKSSEASFDEENKEEEPEKECCKPKKPRRHRSDNYKLCFPSRRTRRRWLQDGALLNLRCVANEIVKKPEGCVVTMGFDDTVKAAGHLVHDVKSTNITIRGEGFKKKSLTTGESIDKIFC